MAASINSGEGLPLVQKDQLDHVEWNISNQATRVMRNIAIGAVVAGALAAVVVIASHGGSTLISSYAAIGAGGAAVAAGTVYGALKLFRDRPEKNRADRAWRAADKEGVRSAIGTLQEGDKLTREVKLNGKKYNVEVVKGGDKIKLSSK